LNVSKSSDPERLNNICVANVSNQDFVSPVIDTYLLHGAESFLRS